MKFIAALFVFVLFLGFAAAQDEGACPVGNVYWPHVNCTLFYVCRPQGGVLLVDFCPSGLYWNQGAISCDWPFNVPECENGPTRPPYTIAPTSPTTTIPTTTEPTTTTTTPTTTTPTTTTPTTTVPTTTNGPSTTTTAPVDEICPPGANFWPHPYNCSMYYICMGNDYYLLVCPVGYYFNPVWDNCDLPVNVPECDGGTYPTGPTTTEVTTVITSTPTTTPPTTTTPTTTPPTTTTLPTTTTTTPTTTTRPPDNGCPATGTTKISHEEICEAFWLCVEGVRQEPYFVCPGGLFFDPILQKCNLPSEVDCGNL
ncbi:integumentary mucin C.1 [Folsomia candida]|uniref:Putative chitinase 3 n=1 Tax=Folsomia candida TaxID=158441 RepID=A0A226EMF4_FOLCA|nr:integumentary mucin C.1 [Folsomia candida]OXA57736.1 putative chitinase 3 [Folsomia candida]